MTRASAAQFDKRISIWRSGKVDDGTATVDGPPEEICKRWAKKVDISDGERFRASENAQGLTTRWTVRADALTRTIAGTDFLMHKGMKYEVIGTKERAEREDVIEITTAARPDTPRAD